MKYRTTIISSCESLRDGPDYLKSYEKKSVRLAYSIRNNGGKYKNLPIVMWHAADAPPSEEVKSKLEGMGCIVVEGETLLEEEPIANKIVASSTKVGTEFSLWLDSDIYLLDSEGFESLVELDVDFAAVGSARAQHRWASFDYLDRWEEMYGLVGVNKPESTLLSGLESEPCIFYFNSAVVFFRGGRGFSETWVDLAPKIRYSGIKDIKHNFTQTSLTLTALKTKSTWKQLDVRYNAYIALMGEKAFDGVFLHYQDNVVDNCEKVVWDV